MDRWMNRDGLALGRSLVRYVVGLLIGRVVLDSMGRGRIGYGKETGFRNGLV